MLAGLEDRIERLAESDRAPAQRLLDRLRTERTKALAELHRVLDGARYRKLLDALVAAAETPRFDVDTDIDVPAVDVVPKLARKPWKKLRREVSELDAEPSDDALHQVRIRAKRARYASEAAAAAVGAKAERSADELADLQDVLGELHDAVVAEGWLRNAAVHAAPDEALVAGLLVARERADAIERRGTWDAVWDRARGKKHTAWLKR
jgi:CHAD domain-containing protein